MTPHSSAHTASSFVVQLTTAKGTVFHYGPFEARTPSEAAARVLGASEARAALQPLGEARWEATSTDGSHVLVWSDRRRLPTPKTPYRRLLWVHL